MYVNWFQNPNPRANWFIQSLTLYVMNIYVTGSLWRIYDIMMYTSENISFCVHVPKTHPLTDLNMILIGLENCVNEWHYWVDLFVRMLADFRDVWDHWMLFSLIYGIIAFITCCMVVQLIFTYSSCFWWNGPIYSINWNTKSFHSLWQSQWHCSFFSHFNRILSHISIHSTIYVT